jgi:hypothetical protein
MSYIVCFWDKSKLQVSDETAEKLKEAILNDTIKGFELGAGFYSVGGVEKIINKERAYNVFPTEYELLSSLNDLPTNDLPQLENYKLPGESQDIANLEKLRIIKEKK